MIFLINPQSLTRKVNVLIEQVKELFVVKNNGAIITYE